MENLIKYLQSVKNSLQNLQNIENIHIVLGNESCDIDSSVSAVLLGYLLHTRKTDLSVTVVVPVQNITKEAFLYRADNCHLYEEIGIPLDLLVYRDQINFEDLVKTKKVTTTLVDHHVLNDNDKVLENTVVEIFDHRPRESGCNWDENKVNLNINEVGSCCTLVADHILCSGENILAKELGYLLYATIVCDCKALRPECGKAKQLDHKIVEALESKFDFAHTRETLFKKIQKIHNQTSHLTPKQILMKDTKIISKIPIPSLPMLAEDFLRLDGAYNDLKEYANESNAPIIVLKGSGSGKKDVAVYFTEDNENLRDRLIERFFNSQKYTEYDFSFSKKLTNFPDIILLDQGNLQWSRKQLVPLIKSSVDSFSKSSLLT